MKKEIEITVDPITGKKSIDMKFDLAGFEDFVSNNIRVEWRSYYDWWEERAKPLHKYWNGFKDFLQADAPNRPVIMADAAKLMKSWFSNGVTFTPPSIIGAITYEHEPPEALKEARVCPPVS